VCPLSNLRTGAVASLDEHPLPQLIAAGVQCSISTDDPAMFDTDLTRDYEAAASLGLSPRAAYEAGVAGALCDEPTRERLRTIGRDFTWDR
jgi:aminodeoxyfutalosine deaminase